MSDAAGHSKTASVTVSVAGDRTETVIYTDAQSLVTFTWAGDGGTNTTAITEVSSDQFEGSNSYQLSFAIGGYWAGGGIGLNSMDFSGQDSLIVCYKGMTSPFTLMVGLAFADNTDTGNNGFMLQPASSWTRAAIPMSTYSTFSSQLGSVTGVNFIVSGAQTGGGTLYLDNILLVSGAGGGTAVSSPAGLRYAGIPEVGIAGRNITVNGIRDRELSLVTLSGKIVSRARPGIGGPAVLRASAAGVFLIMDDRRSVVPAVVR